MGLQFENLVLGNLAVVLDRAGLASVPMLNAGPFYQPRKASCGGCQIDLLARSRHSLYVFEVKFRKQIDKSVIKEVKEKIRRPRRPRDLSVRTGLVYQGELHPEIESAGYFDFLLPFSDLLK